MSEGHLIYKTNVRNMYLCAITHKDLISRLTNRQIVIVCFCSQTEAIKSAIKIVKN